MDSIDANSGWDAGDAGGGRDNISLSQLRRLFEGTVVRSAQLPAATSREHAVVPASHGQEGLWLLQQAGAARAYRIPLPIHIAGTLDVPSLQRSFAELVRRHEILRTRFAMNDGQLLQFADVPSPGLSFVDLAALTRAEKNRRTRELLQQQIHAEFDLERGPLLRVTLLRRNARSHVLVITLHHIASDEWSMEVLFRQLGSIYEAYVHGRAPAPAPSTAQYADYALWQRQYLRGDVLEKLLRYWRGKLHDAPELLQLPTDRVRPAVQNFQGAAQTFRISRQVSERLRRLGQRHSATQFMVLLSACKLLLWRCSGQNDLVVGSPVAARTQRDHQELIGYFSNTLVLRTQVSGELTFTELLKRVKETALAAQAHQDLPLERLVHELKPQRDASHQPLFQVLFALNYFSAGQLQLPGVRLRLLPVSSKR